jgi:hypothetical protein
MGFRVGVTDGGIYITSPPTARQRVARKEVEKVLQFSDNP